MLRWLSLILLAGSSVLGAGRSIEEGKKHWAMIAPQVVPGASIDGLIDKQLAEKNLTPNAPASRSALVRRLQEIRGLPTERFPTSASAGDGTGWTLRVMRTATGATATS